MTTDDRRLLRHLVIAVLVKLAALAALWFWFVRDATVRVDSDRAALRLVSPPGRAALSQGNSK
jgi:hypothetical protein